MTTRSRVQPVCGSCWAMLALMGVSGCAREATVSAAARQTGDTGGDAAVEVPTGSPPGASAEDATAAGPEADAGTVDAIASVDAEVADALIDASLLTDAADAADAALDAAPYPSFTDTDQTGTGSTLYEAWANWPMPTPPSLGLPHPASYDTTTPGVLVDNVTTLTWQREPPDREFTWDEADAYCRTLRIGTYGDWRLPSRAEMLSTYDATRMDPPFYPEFTMYPGPYGYSTDRFWTSTRVTTDRSRAFTASAYWESMGPEVIATAHPAGVRCVRSAALTDALPPARYVVKVDTARDTLTGLTWQRGQTTGGIPWSSAASYCGGLTIDGGGFRLPTPSELATLVDESQFPSEILASGAPAGNPMIDPTAFPFTARTEYWGNSTAEDYNGTVDFMLGIDFLVSKNGRSVGLGFLGSADAMTRCVK